MKRINTALCISVLIIMLSGCKKLHDQPSAPFSSIQQDLFSKLATSGTDTLVATTLAQAVHSRVEEYYGTGSSVDSGLGRMIDSAVLYLSSRLFMVTDAEAIVREMNALIFDKWGITFIDDRNNSDYLFPHNVLQKRQGSCVGISLLYLLVAEKNGTPLFGVLVPGHFYERFDDGKSVINIEMMRHGEDMPNRWYRQRFGISDTTLYDMRNLKWSEAAAVLDYNIGTLFLRQKVYERAIFFLEKSIAGMPSFAEAEGNCALALNSAGKSREALVHLVALKKKYPSLPNIDGNIASLQLSCNDFQAALRTYDALLEKDPADPDYLYGKGLALYRLNNLDEAEHVLQAVVNTPSDSGRSEKLLQTVRALKEHR